MNTKQSGPVGSDSSAGLGGCNAPVAPPRNDDPNAWVRFWLDSALRCKDFRWDDDQRALAEAAVLAAAPQPPERVPLTDEQTTRLFIDLNARCVGAEGPSEMFAAIVRAVEAAHGIGLPLNAEVCGQPAQSNE